MLVIVVMVVVVVVVVVVVIVVIVAIAIIVTISPRVPDGAPDGIVWYSTVLVLYNIVWYVNVIL